MTYKIPSIFCDWLTIYQKHFIDLPIINSGHVFSVDSDGEIEWETSKRFTHKGSFDSKIFISCDGSTVYLSGNVGRFNRSDNVFGYSVSDCVLIANKILSSFDLPPFSSGKLIPISKKFASNVTSINMINLDINSDVDAGFIHDGACITRVDLTKNYSAGSAQNASSFILAAQGFKLGKFEPKSYQNKGVSWGEGEGKGNGSKWFYAKLYDKAADYIRHFSKDSKFFNVELYNYLLNFGIVRHEISLKSRYLKQNNLNQIKNWDSKMEAKIYALFTDPIYNTAKVDDFLEIPGKYGAYAVLWRDGADLKKRLAHSTFKRYRKKLLEYGVDISLPVNTARLNIRVEIIELKPAQIPHWYSLPQAQNF